MADLNLLKKSFLFKDLTDDELTLFAGASESKSFDDGEVVIDEGKEGDAIYIVEEGKVVVTKSENEVRSIMVTLSAGEQFGEMSILESAPTSAKVTAEGAVVLLKLPRAAFLKVLDENPTVAARVYRMLALSLSHRLRQTSADLMTWKPGFDF